MKNWKCPNCKREKETEDSIVTIMCKCGDYFQDLLINKKYCPKSPQKQKGKNTGELWRLNKRLNNIDTCQCYRRNFVYYQNDIK